MTSLARILPTHARYRSSLRCLFVSHTPTRRSMTTLESLNNDISAANARLTELRQQAADAALVEEAKKRLGELKKSLMLLQNSAGGSKDAGKRKERMLLKTAKGTRDYGPAEMTCREHIEGVVKETFLLFGGGCLDTPVFERKDVLTGKYGEDQKLIFDLADQGGEELALRYDHTVPLARYLAMSGAATTQAKLWQIGKVYRRDNPVMSKGRMREFTQADFDVAGTYDSMIPDAEIIGMVCSILSKLDVGEFTIKLNHRRILDGIFEVCGVPTDKIRTISSAVDKLDKSPWAEVKKEMTDEKGLAPEVADKIGEYVKHKGGADLLARLTSDEALMSNASAKQGIADMEILFNLLKAYNVLDKISFDMSLARGLDYYTGIIYEAVVAASAPPNFDAANAVAANASTTVESTPTPAPPPKAKKAKKVVDADGEEDAVDDSTVGVGSIAAGGRYDNLVAAFSAAAAGEGKKALSLPCVGVSIGMDRVFALVWPRWVERGMRAKQLLAFVMSAGDGLLAERIALTTELRAAGIKTDFLAKNKPKITAQFAAGERDEVPFAIILGTDELKEGLVTVKEQKWELVDGKKVKVESADKGTKVKRDELVTWLKATDTYRAFSEGRWV